MKGLFRLVVMEAVAVAAAFGYCYVSPGTFPSLTAWFSIHTGGVMSYQCTVGGRSSGFVDQLCGAVMHDVASPRWLIVLAAGTAILWAASRPRPVAPPTIGS